MPPHPALLGVSPRQAAGSWRAAPSHVARPGLRFVQGRATCPCTRDGQSTRGLALRAGRATCPCTRPQRRVRVGRVRGTRVCGVASRTPAHLVVTAWRQTLSHSVRYCNGPRGLPVVGGGDTRRAEPACGRARPRRASSTRRVDRPRPRGRRPPGARAWVRAARRVRCSRRARAMGLRGRGCGGGGRGGRKREGRARRWVRVGVEGGAQARHLHGPSWHRTERRMGIANSRGGLPGTRGCARALQVERSSERPCMHACEAAHASPAQSQHMTHPRRGATCTGLGPPRRARARRRTRERTSHGPRSAARRTREPRGNSRHRGAARGASDRARGVAELRLVPSRKPSKITISHMPNLPRAPPTTTSTTTHHPSPPTPSPPTPPPRPESGNSL